LDRGDETPEADPLLPDEGAEPEDDKEKDGVGEEERLSGLAGDVELRPEAGHRGEVGADPEEVGEPQEEEVPHGEKVIILDLEVGEEQPEGPQDHADRQDDQGELHWYRYVNGPSGIGSCSARSGGSVV